MESEQQDIPNSNLRHDSSPPGLRRMSSLFKRIMRKEDASANSSSRNIIVPQLKRSLHREAENTDSTTAGNRLLSWIRSSSDISRSSSKDWRRGSGSSKSSYSSVFSKGRYSYGSTTLTSSTSARRSSVLSSTARLRRSGTFSALAKTPIVNERALSESIKSGRGPQESSESPEGCQFVPCSCADLPRCPHTSMSPAAPVGLAKPDLHPGESELSINHPMAVPRTLPDFYDELHPRRLSYSAEVEHRQSHLRVTPPMDESPRETLSWAASSNRSTHVTEYDSTTASEYEDDLSEENHMLTPLTGLLIDRLLRAFYNSNNDGTPPSPANHHLHHHHHHTCHGTSESSSPRSSPGGDQSRGTASSSSTTHDPHHRIRHGRAMGGSRGNEAHDSGGEEEDEDRPVKRVCNTPKEAMHQPPLLACPFCKWKPLTYQNCYKYVLKDISRVKQHLRRNHRRPPYCPKCWQTFNSEESRDGHIRTDSCFSQEQQAAAPVLLPGVTAAQQEQLDRRVDKKLSKADQWFSMYAILFPDCPRPRSPYVESDLSAELLSFQRFMGAEGLAIVEQTAREHISVNASRDLQQQQQQQLLPYPQQYQQQQQEQEQEQQLVEFSQTLFQHAIPRILQRYEATRPNNNNNNHHNNSNNINIMAASSSDSGYGSSTRSGGRVSREIERPVLRAQGLRSIYPMRNDNILFPSPFSFDPASPHTGHDATSFATFPPPSMPANDEPLADFDMDSIDRFSF